MTIIEFLILIPIVLGYFMIIGNFLMLVAVGIQGVELIDGFLNPKTIYENRRVNKFGCTMLTLFFNVFFIVHAIWFWFYKLCTVGRI